MNVLFLFRSKGTGYSIEELFNGLMEELNRNNSYAVSSVVMPKLSSSIFNILRNLQFVRQLKSDIYHITGDNHYLALVLPRHTTVLTIHDCVMLSRCLQERRYLKFAFFWLFWYYLPIWKAGQVTCISAKTKNELSHFIGRRLASKIKVISNWVDPRLAPCTRSFDTVNPVILQIGTAPNKNLDRLVEALNNLPCRLNIIGALKKETRAKLERYDIDFAQSMYLKREEVIQKYRECDLVAFVSTYEGFGMPVIEANAVGRPVLTSNLSPMREVAGSAAHLIDPFDVQAIREGILKLIKDSEYRDRLVKNGFENAKRFTRSQIANEYIQLYQSIN